MAHYYDSGYYNTAELTPVDNEILEVKLESQLDTAMDMMQFAHADYSLTEAPGMVKKIRKYIGAGALEELAMGEGNTDDFEATWDEIFYRVGTTQGRGYFYDEQRMSDPTVIEKMIQHIGEEMTNDHTRKIIKEMNTTSNRMYGVTFGFDLVSDVLASFPDESTENESLFMLISRKDSTIWRKALRDDLKYVEQFVRKGYVGHVCGIPVYWNDAVPQGKAFIGTKEAVTVFVKKGVEVEQERDANVRKNTVYSRKVELVALTNDAKMFALSTIANPAAGKTAILVKPANWDTNYNDYYHIDPADDTFKKNNFAECPNFVPGRYFNA